MRQTLRVVVWLCGLLAISTFAAGAQDAVNWQKATPPLATRWYDEVSPENALPDYPRPQMVREDWLNLNGLWQFETAAEGEAPPFGRTLDEQILVPFPVESALSGLMRHESRMWYRREFAIPAAWAGESLLLHFGAVDWQATVYVNGEQVGEHQGGYDGFGFDITPYLNDENPQEIIVGVYDPSDLEGQPRGKQTLTPGNIWYSTVSGIWQTVWLEPVAPTHIERLVMTPDIDAGVLSLIVAATGDEANTWAEVTAYAEGEAIASAQTPANTEVLISIPEMRLWSPDDPFLYDLRVTLHQGDQAVDQVTSYFGMRKISLGDLNGSPRIMLNNEFVFQIGALDQGYWPDGLYTAPTDEALRYDIEFAKELGWNMVRKHVKVEPERWYYWADRLGLLVWQDMPNGDAQNLLTYPEAEFEAELRALVNGRRNHPSLVLWVVFNEGWGQEQYGEDGNARLTDVVRELDPSRLIIHASGWTDMGLGDINDIHTYPGPLAPLPEASRAGVQGEFGGLGLRVPNHEWRSEVYAYEWQDNAALLMARYIVMLQRVTQLMVDFNLSAAVYTEITDIEAELNGFITYDREVIKVDVERISAANRALIEQSILLQRGAN